MKSSIFLSRRATRKAIAAAHDNVELKHNFRALQLLASLSGLLSTLYRCLRRLSISSFSQKSLSIHINNLVNYFSLASDDSFRFFSPGEKWPTEIRYDLYCVIPILNWMFFHADCIHVGGRGDCDSFRDARVVEFQVISFRTNHLARRFKCLFLI